jgi:hypothetical protein
MNVMSTAIDNLNISHDVVDDVLWRIRDAYGEGLRDDDAVMVLLRDLTYVLRARGVDVGCLLDVAEIALVSAGVVADQPPAEFRQAFCEHPGAAGPLLTTGGE